MSEVNRVNFANSVHHKELIRKQIDPATIDKLEIAQNPSLNYRSAFKNVYQDELEKTMEEQLEKKQAQKSLYQNAHSPSSLPHNAHSQSLSRLQRSFLDYEQEKMKRVDTLVEQQLQRGDSFFRAQEQYQRKRQQEQQSTNHIIRQQVELKEALKCQGAEQSAKENREVWENRKRQMELEMMEKERSRIARADLGSEIRGQMEKERIRRNHKSILQLGQLGRHNPITNPI